ncbi:hypothetical protein ACQP0C_41740 (plasmid) [Nocardia sp. CA-129566]|uniref:hypothetical protein n=1 Tax=Nocardia sp. CA-129566 TaxID=3239976 RepID=UPI003D96BE88
MPEIIALCGSMRFFPQMLDVAAEQTVAGRIVVPPFKTVPADQQDSPLKARLDELHRHKIEMADHVLVVTDVTGYIGESTRNEIEYAQATGKPVTVLRRGRGLSRILTEAHGLLAQASELGETVVPADEIAEQFTTMRQAYADALAMAEMSLNYAASLVPDDTAVAARS